MLTDDVKPGDRCGSWTVISIDGDKAIVECSCGARGRQRMRLSQFTGRKSHGCAKCTKARRDARSEPGARVGAWIVIDANAVHEGLTMAHVECSCGEFRGFVDPRALRWNAAGCAACRKRAEVARHMRRRPARKRFAPPAVGDVIGGFRVLGGSGDVLDVECLGCRGRFVRAAGNLRKNKRGCSTCATGTQSGRPLTRCACGGVRFADGDPSHVCNGQDKITDYMHARGDRTPVWHTSRAYAG